MSGTANGDDIQNASGDYVPNEVIVRFNTEGITANSLYDIQATTNAEIGATVIADADTLGVPGLQTVKIPSSTSVEQAISYYSNNPLIKYAEPNYICRGEYFNAVSSQDIFNENNRMFSEENGTNSTAKTFIPNDIEYPKQWGLNNTGQNGGIAGSDIDAPHAWYNTKGSLDVFVAVLDTGVDYNHPDLQVNCIPGFNFIDNNADPMDKDGHGTHCAGIISAIGNNSIGVAGVSWNSKIMPIKVLGEDGGDVSTIISGIQLASNKGARIISMSLGMYSYSQAFKDAIDQSKALFICSAGNDGVDTDRVPHYPSGYDSYNILSVGASNEYDFPAVFSIYGASNYGKSTVDVFAPGNNILSTTPDNTYSNMSGTSMATPMVSGIAALILSMEPTLTNSEIKTAIMTTVDQSSNFQNKCVTGGRVNAYKATEQFVKIPFTPVIADFRASPTSGTIPLTVQFLDLSKGTPDYYNWSFGDGFTSSEKNPVHLYMKPGIYTVSLLATRWDMSDLTEYSNLIHVKPPYQPVKAFPNKDGGFYPDPTDADDDGLFEDINGNGWLEYEDPKLLFDQILFGMKEEPIGQFDFDKSGFIGFGDVVKLYQMV